MLERWLALHVLAIQIAISIFSAVASTAAAVAAWRAASSTRRSVLEAREARLQAVRPVLYLATTSASIAVDWKRESGGLPTLQFKTKSGDLSSPFSLINAVGYPAFDTTIKWRLDPQVVFNPSSRLASLQHSADADKLSITYGKGEIKFLDQDGEDGFLSRTEKYGNEAETKHFEVLKDSSKSISIPGDISRLQMLWSLSQAEQAQIYKTHVSIPTSRLEAEVSYSSPSGERITSKFSFEVVLFGATFFAPPRTYLPKGQLPTDWAAYEVSGYIRPLSREPIDREVERVTPMQEVTRTIADEAFRIFSRGIRAALPF